MSYHLKQLAENVDLLASTPVPLVGPVSVVPDRAAGETLRLDYEECAIQIYATSETRKPGHRGVYRLDPATVEWVERVAPGEVLFDIGAGVGAYTLLAARRGARVVAFEPGFASYDNLCRNILLNRCDGQVIPVPQQLSDREGLASVKYQGGRVGEDGHWIKEDYWKERPSAAGGLYIHPMLVMRLDVAIGNYGLPQPRHLRIGSPNDCARILRGAAATLADRALTAAFVLASDADYAEIAAILSSNGFETRAEDMANDVRRLLCTRVL